jgi:hypothetical protein
VWKQLAGDLWGREGEGGLEITKLAFLSGSKPPSRTSRRPPGWAQAGFKAKLSCPLLRVQGARGRAVWHPHPDDPPQGYFLLVDSLGSCVGSYGANRSIPTLPTLF